MMGKRPQEAHEQYLAYLLILRRIIIIVFHVSIEQRFLETKLHSER